ncbi:MAG: SdiA-regulated domain-containing protein [Bacteroidota bacterium]
MKVFLGIGIISIVAFATAFCIRSSEAYDRDAGLKSAVFVVPPNTSGHKQEYLPYDFNSPEIMELNKKLKEISGLSYNAIANTMYTHNDEKGHIYEIDMTDGHIINDLKFGEKGDYEGIEVVFDKIVVVENNGNLNFYNRAANETVKIKTVLTKKNNVEGLCLDADQKLLLMACKGEVLNKESEKNSTKEIYAYDMSKKEVIAEPYLQIKRRELLDNFEQNFQKIPNDDLKKYKSRIKEFSPSGIAVHPVNGNLYIISARGSILLVFDRELQLKQQVFLSKKKAPQPEGICFDHHSNLYIATEGKTSNGKLLKYESKSN